MSFRLKNNSLAIVIGAAFAAFAAVPSGAQIAPIGERATSITIRAFPTREA